MDESPREGASPAESQRTVIRRQREQPPSAPPREGAVDLEWRNGVLLGSHPGDRYIRVARHTPKSTASGHVEVTSRETEPRSRLGRLHRRVKRVVIGAPLTTAQASHERLTKPKALAVLSSDALSSVAYATEEIMRVLLLAGAAALSVSLPIGLAIVVLLFIVGFSYRQTIKAYPGGGGSYIVAKDNLGTLPGLTAAGSLLISYILTVSVSIAAGVVALTSALPALADHDVALGIGVIVIVTMINLRGIRESGTVFMIPTYAFLACMGALLVAGLARFGLGPPVEPRVAVEAVQPLTLLLVLRAFSSGGAALTGVEAISDGVPAFQKPEWVNAQKTLTAMILLLATMFFGVTYLANRIGVVPSAAEGAPEHETVVSQIARAVFGVSPLYYAVQFATFLVLFLAANTAYADFPRLSYFLARDRFLPRQFTFRGDRLAYSVGIVVLGVVSALVLWAFSGEISRLIPLYAFGVFSAFTWSQAGMVVRWWRRREPGWRASLVINGIGATTTFVVLLVVATTRFFDGAWMVVVLLPLLILMFRGIHAHYAHAASEMAPETPLDPDEIRHLLIVPFAALNRVGLQTLAYARSLSPNVTAVHVVEDAEEIATLRDEWRGQVAETPFLRDVKLVMIESPYRSLTGPLLSYIDELDQLDPHDTLTVILPEFVPAHWWEHILHKQTALRLKAALLFRPGTVVTSVPYHLTRDAAQRAGREAAVGDG
jgi:amino acid transporter